MSKKILIVDDEPDLLEVTTFRLKKNGYNVISAIDGQEALVMIERESPDLILLDLRLPIMSGQEVCKKIKCDPVMKKIAVIIFTASASGEMEKMTKELGADSYLIKPFDADNLLKQIKKFIG